MRYFLRLLAVMYLGLLAIWLSVPAQAQTQTTTNIINPAGTAWGIPSGQVLNNGQIQQVEGVGPTSGTAYYNSSTNTIRFSYLPSTVSQTIAINSVLSGLGIQIRGYNWNYQWMNGGYSSGTLTGSISMTTSQNAMVEQTNFNHPIQPADTWQTETGTRTFVNPYELAAVNTISMTFSGNDNRFWNGLYGPRVRDPSLTLNYTVDQCTLNPLSSPDCPGYQQAQCTISPLYSPSCPGYQQAYLTQQCSINPLYDPTCPGYQEAYFQYQCQQDGLYSTSCPNYAEAYAKKQLLSQTTTEPTTTTTTTSTATTDPVTIATTSTTTSATSPTSVTSVTSVVSATSTTTTGTTNATTTAATTSTPVATTSTAPAAETKKTDSEIRTATAGSSSGSAARGRAEARAREISKAAAQAPTLESQAETQGLVVGLMGFVPGFDAYSQIRITDVNGLAMQRQYSKPTVDNRSALRQLSGASQGLHREMVDQQWQGR